MIICIHETVENELYSGRTKPADDTWQTYTGPTTETSGLYVDIDYSGAGFSEPPIIQATLIGEVDNWVMQVTATDITSTTARIYIRSTLSGYRPTATEATNKVWSVAFLAAATGADCTIDVTYETNATDHA